MEEYRTRRDSLFHGVDSSEGVIAFDPTVRLTRHLTSILGDSHAALATSLARPLRYST